VNVNGNHSWYLWSNYNKSKGGKKPRYGFNLNGSGNRYINFVNGERVETNSNSVSLSLNFGIDVDDKYEFSINPSAGYNASRSSFTTANNNNYFTYGGQVYAGVDLPWKLEINSNVNFDLRQHINAFASNTNLVIWNAGIIKKLFKKDVGKISFYANDLLDDNKGFTRTINSTFISDDRFQRISRYFLLKFEWSFNKMPGGEKK
jgi:hypothetical protein